MSTDIFTLFVDFNLLTWYNLYKSKYKMRCDHEKRNDTKRIHKLSKYNSTSTHYRKNSKKNFKEIWAHFKRWLQAWENAKKIKVKKTFAKVFPASVLDNAYKLNENYLSQILKLNSDEVQHQKQFNEWMNNTQTDIVSEEEF